VSTAQRAAQSVGPSLTSLWARGRLAHNPELQPVGFRSVGQGTADCAIQQMLLAHPKLFSRSKRQGLLMASCPLKKRLRT